MGIGEGLGVAAEAGELGALDGAVAEGGGELLLRHAEHLLGGEVEHTLSSLKFGVRCGGGLAIVGASDLTLVAAVEVIPYFLVHPFGETFGSVFDGLAR